MEWQGLRSPPAAAQRTVWEIRWKVLERCETGQEHWTEHSRIVLGTENGLETCLKLSAREMGRKWEDEESHQSWKVAGFSVLSLKQVLVCEEA